MTGKIWHRILLVGLTVLLLCSALFINYMLQFGTQLFLADFNILFFNLLLPLLGIVLLLWVAAVIVARNLTQQIVKRLDSLDPAASEPDESWQEIKELSARIHKHNSTVDQQMYELSLRQKEFTANVSHELKTPLTSISGFAELMKEGLVPEERVKEFSGDIYQESQRMINLVDDIINLSRLDEETGFFEQEVLDLYDLTAEILANLQPLAQKRQIVLQLQGSHAVIYGVWQIINEMIYNLCDNAIKYNKDGGLVTVSIMREDSAVKLTVADTGIGIPEDHQKRIFERFYRVDKSHSRKMGGTGLGLSIVKHGAQYHKATIDLKSKTAIGTTITISFQACNWQQRITDNN